MKLGITGVEWESVLRRRVYAIADFAEALDEMDCSDTSKFHRLFGFVRGAAESTSQEYEQAAGFSPQNGD
ncbi:MAG: hypothetical protein AAF702_49625 [Chloroflexota bacterium]